LGVKLARLDGIQGCSNVCRMECCAVCSCQDITCGFAMWDEYKKLFSIKSQEPIKRFEKSTDSHLITLQSNGVMDILKLGQTKCFFTLGKSLLEKLDIISSCKISRANQYAIGLTQGGIKIIVSDNKYPIDI